MDDVNTTVQQDPAVEPTEPTTEPTAAIVEPDTGDGISIEELQEQLESERAARAIAEKKRKEAETAIDLEKKAHAKLKRSQMSADEQLEAQRAELAEQAKNLSQRINGATAREVLATGGFVEDDYQDVIDLLIREDEEQTTALAHWIVDIVKNKTRLAAKVEREKVLKEQPAPPAGDDGQATDPFVEGFMKG